MNNFDISRENIPILEKRTESEGSMNKIGLVLMISLTTYFAAYCGHDRTLGLTLADVEVLDTSEEMSETLPVPDDDGDGFTASTDCDDHNNTIYPGAAERCDGLDNDCDGDVDEGCLNPDAGDITPAEVAGDTVQPIDNDGDGYNADVDCDDSDPDINPAATEVCDFIDNDCDGVIDDGFEYNDCGLCGPAPAEICGNHVDDDCDGETDDADDCMMDADGDGFGPDVDCDDSDPDINPAATEVCDYVDNDCDDVIDDGFDYNDCGLCGPAPAEICGNHLDDDCDGETDDAAICQVDGDGDGYNADVDCDDADPDINPVATEVCDYVDNDCDGATDEGVAKNVCGECGPDPVEFCDGEDNDCDGATDEEGVCSVDLDGDGFDGDVDCDDLNPDINPAADEICDGVDQNCNDVADEAVTNVCGECGPDPIEVCDEVDNDCDGSTDEDGVCDADGDGFDPPEDCDDTNPAINPDAEELCDYVDNDCNDGIDEGVQNACGTCGPLGEACDGIDNDCDGATDEDGACSGVDADGDGYNSLVDCDDANIYVYPGAPESLNGLDNDCDGETDEGLCGNDVCEPIVGENDTTCWEDCGSCFDGEERFCLRPGNSVGNCAVGKQTCASNVWGSCMQAYAAKLNDTCGNGLDDDCDGHVDESACQNQCGDGFCGATETCTEDCPTPSSCSSTRAFCLVAGQHGICSIGNMLCVSGSWGECEQMLPPHPEVCDSEDDEDCDGEVDEVDCVEP
ncbi:MAG: putative metal-binding motif-containing protein [Patescibacteria group bacterium]